MRVPPVEMVNLPLSRLVKHGALVAGQELSFFWPPRDKRYRFKVKQSSDGGSVFSYQSPQGEEIEDGNPRKFIKKVQSSY